MSLRKRILLRQAWGPAGVMLGLLTGLTGLTAPAVRAQTAPSAPAPAQAAPGPTRAALPPAAAAPARPASAAVPDVERRVIEDDGVRIEQVNVRGQPQSVVVQSKLGAVRPYEIVLVRDGRDPSLYKGAAGASRWSLLDF